jgi:hypothetical protein
MNVTPPGPAWSAAWGVTAVVFGGGAVSTWLEAVATGSKFPAWPAWILALVTVVALCLCFISLRRRRQTRLPGSRASSHHPVNVELVPEQADDHLRLGLLNHGPADEFSAQVTGIIDPMGRTIGPQHWIIPWLEDNSVEPKRIFVGQTRMLNFARYDAIAINAELSNGEVGGHHWWFSSVPTPTGARYYNLRSADDLEEQHFILTVRIMSASSEKYFDRRLKVAFQHSRLTCEPIPDQPPE